MARTYRIKRGNGNRAPEIFPAPDARDLGIVDPVDTGSLDSDDAAGSESANDDAGSTEPNGDTRIIDPASLTPGDTGAGTDAGTGSGGSSEPRRGRGRPPGSGKGAGKGAGNKQSKTAATASLERLLFSVHMMGAMFVNQPTLMLEQQEAKQLSEAITAVTELYELPFLDEKSQAWAALGFCVATIYAPRIVAMVNENKKKKGPQLVTGVVNG